METNRLDPENFGHESRITSRTRRSLQLHRDLLQARSLLGTRSCFLFGDNATETDEQRQEYLLQTKSNFESNVTESFCHTSQLNEPTTFLEGSGRSRQCAEDLKVFDFVDSTKQLILKGWNSRQFRRHKLATYNWSYRAPQPLMDSRYFSRIAAKDICEPAVLTAATMNSGVSIFTPKYGVSARNTVLENCGILFFTKDIGFDYKLTLRHMRDSHPKLLSSRYYVPFLTFVRALRQNRVERDQPRRVNTRNLIRGTGWLLLIIMLLIFLIFILEEPHKLSKQEQKKNFLLIIMISAPLLAFLLGFSSS